MNTTEQNVQQTVSDLDHHAATSDEAIHTTVAMAVKAICLALLNVANAIREHNHEY